MRSFQHHPLHEDSMIFIGMKYYGRKEKNETTAGKHFNEKLRLRGYVQYIHEGDPGHEDPMIEGERNTHVRNGKRQSICDSRRCKR